MYIPTLIICRCFRFPKLYLTRYNLPVNQDDFMWLIKIWNICCQYISWGNQFCKKCQNQLEKNIKSSILTKQNIFSIPLDNISLFPTWTVNKKIKNNLLNLKNHYSKVLTTSAFFNLSIKKEIPWLFSWLS